MAAVPPYPSPRRRLPGPEGKGPNGPGFPLGAPTGPRLPAGLGGQPAFRGGANRNGPGRGLGFSGGGWKTLGGSKTFRGWPAKGLGLEARNGPASFRTICCCNRLDLRRALLDPAAQVAPLLPRRFEGVERLPPAVAVPEPQALAQALLQRGVLLQPLTCVQAVQARSSSAGCPGALQVAPVPSRVDGLLPRGDGGGEPAAVPKWQGSPVPGKDRTTNPGPWKKVRQPGGKEIRQGQGGQVPVKGGHPGPE